MTSKEMLKKAWDLIHDKYPENNDEIQLVRYAIKMAMNLAERNTPMNPKFKINIQNGKVDFVCLSCNFSVAFKDNYCSHCGQKLDWSDL